MKHLTLLPFLIAAILVMPRAHAASYAIDNEPSSYTTALVCLLLILLANGRPRVDTFKQDQAR